MFPNLQNKSNDSMSLIGSHFCTKGCNTAYREDVAYALNSESGCNVQCTPSVHLFIPKSMFYTQSIMPSPCFIQEPVFYTQS